MSSYCEEPELFSEGFSKARKLHKCIECSKPINVGEKYYWCKGRWHDDWLRYNQHLKCLEACVLIRDKYNGGECLPFGGLFGGFGEIGLHYKSKKELSQNDKKIRSLIAQIILRQRNK